jgi:positive regulator of sigma E activity
MKVNSIKHQGIIQNINDNQLEIMIISESACSSCKSKKVCSISEIKEKLVYVDKFEGLYQIGDKVTVFLEEKMGAYAVVFTYVLPFIIMITILLLGYNNNVSEPVMGLSVLLSLAIYFYILYLFRDQFRKKVGFSVEKLNNNPLFEYRDEVLEN